MFPTLRLVLLRLAGSITYYAQLLDGATVDQAGAYWIDLERYQGFGSTTIHVELEVRSLDGGFPMGGWAVVIGSGGTGDLGTSREAGVPLTRTGAHFVWQWGTVNMMNGFPESADRMAYGSPGGWRWRGQLFVQPGRVIVGSNFDSSQTTVMRQDFTVEYHPENTDTTALEEYAIITLPGGTTHTYRPDLDGNTVDPQNDVPIGSRLSIGITAGSYAHTFSPGGTPVTVGAQIEARLRIRTFIMPPPTLPGRYDEHSTVVRAGICPGAF